VIDYVEIIILKKANTMATVDLPIKEEPLSFKQQKPLFADLKLSVEWNMVAKDYTPLKRVGKGSYGLIVKAQCKKT
jgi:hypothetical protein